MNRTISKIVYARQYDMGGFPVRQPIPSPEVDQVDPFILLHHANVKVPRHILPKHAGVGPHPHRGFSPVTFVFKGAVHHRDSMGNSSIIYAGGAQWMNAGRGITHSERPSEDIHEIGGEQEIIQLWINTPGKNKMDTPSYQGLKKEDIPRAISEDGKSEINVVAGTIAGIKGPAESQTIVNAATIEMQRLGNLTIEIPESHNAFVYLLKGKLLFETGEELKQFYAAIFKREGNRIVIKAEEDSALMFLSGEPINEKVVSHGPFVMNSETQILEAMRDYQLGKMGVLIEEE